MHECTLCSLSLSLSLFRSHFGSRLPPISARGRRSKLQAPSTQQLGAMGARISGEAGGGCCDGWTCKRRERPPPLTQRPSAPAAKGPSKGPQVRAQAVALAACEVFGLPRGRAASLDVRHLFGDAVTRRASTAAEVEICLWRRKIAQKAHDAPEIYCCTAPSAGDDSFGRVLCVAEFRVFRNALVQGAEEAVDCFVTLSLWSSPGSNQDECLASLALNLKRVMLTHYHYGGLYMAILLNEDTESNFAEIAWLARSFDLGSAGNPPLCGGPIQICPLHASQEEPQITYVCMYIYIYTYISTHRDR